MKTYKLVIITLCVLLLSGCAQSELQSQYNALQADYQALQQEYDQVADDLKKTQVELNQLKQSQKEQQSDRNTNSKWQTMKLGEPIKTNFCEMTVDNLRFEDFVHLLKPSDYGYKAKDGMTYCALDVKTKNIHTKNINPEGVFVRMIVDDTYEYTGSCLSAYTLQFSIAPLETGDYIIMAEMPKEIQDTYKKITLQIGMPENFGSSQFVFEKECKYFYQCDIKK